MGSKVIAISTLAVCAAGMAGCAGAGGTEASFGNAVRQVMKSQIHDPEAAANPDREAVTGGDPDRLNSTLEGHRNDVGNASSVASPITVNVGNPEN